ncbi:hypothetical protein ABZ921_37235 [Streptomyces atriruber]|uniref:Uncharacterized protein n=1 Tax=Streptomyces atriruber TaxID=545121 RepID=A0ABV3BZ47_9ACTN
MSTADALRRKLREREGKAAREELLRRFESLGGDVDALSWLSLEESDSFERDWLAAQGLSPEDQLTFLPAESGQRTWTHQVGTPPPCQVPVPAPASTPRLLILFGNYRSMGIACAAPQWVAESSERLAVADGNGFVAVTESLSYVLQVDLEENDDRPSEIEVTLWGEGTGTPQ